MFRVIVWFVGLLAFAGLCYVITRPTGDAQPVQQPQQTLAEPQGERTSLGNQRASTAPQPLSAEAEEELLEHLARFGMPSMDFDSVDLSTMADRIGEVYASLEKERDLKFFVDTDVAARGGRVRFNTENMSLVGVLQLASAQAGMEMEVHEGGISFNPSGEQPKSRVFLDQEYPLVMSVFDPEILYAYGVERLEGSEIVFNDQTMELIVKHNAYNQELVRSILAAFKGPKQSDIVVTSQIVAVPRDAGYTEQVMNLEQAEQMKAEWEAAEQVSVIAPPSMVTRSGQLANIEVSREVVLQDQEVDRQGILCAMAPYLQGEQVVLSGNLDLRVPEGTAVSGALDPTVAVSEGAPVAIESHTTEFNAVLEEGQAALIKAYEGEGSPSIYMLVTAKRQ